MFQTIDMVVEQWPDKFWFNFIYVFPLTDVKNGNELWNGFCFHMFQIGRYSSAADSRLNFEYFLQTFFLLPLAENKFLFLCVEKSRDLKHNRVNILERIFIFILSVIGYIIISICHYRLNNYKYGVYWKIKYNNMYSSTATNKVFIHFDHNKKKLPIKLRNIIINHRNFPEFYQPIWAIQFCSRKQCIFLS